MKNIAVFLTGHLRTGFKQIDNLFDNVIKPNVGKCNFLFYVHTYNNIGIEEKTFNVSLRLNYEININDYFLSYCNFLKCEKSLCVPAHHDDVSLFNDLSLEEKQRPGNIMANTFQFTKKTRSYIDFKEDVKKKNIEAIMFTRPDNHYYEKLIIPDIDFTKDDSPIVFSHKDNRINGQCEDDRFSIIPTNKEQFILNLGKNCIEHRKINKKHIMPEESLWYAIDKYKINKQYICKKDVIKIARFSNDHNEKIKYENFIKNNK
jgi:hypothetical protein